MLSEWTFILYLIYMGRMSLLRNATSHVTKPLLLLTVLIISCIAINTYFRSSQLLINSLTTTFQQPLFCPPNITIIKEMECDTVRENLYDHTAAAADTNANLFSQSRQGLPFKLLLYCCHVV